MHVFPVAIHVLRQVEDARRQDRDLHLGGSRVSGLALEARNDLALVVLVDVGLARGLGREKLLRDRVDRGYILRLERKQNLQNGVRKLKKEKRRIKGK